MMKKFFKSALCLLSLVLLFTQCRKDDEVQVGNPDDPNQYITITTTKNVGEKLDLDMSAKLEADTKELWVDINNNQKKDAGEEYLSFPSDGSSRLIPIQNKTVRLYGKVAFIWVENLSHFDATQNGALYDIILNSSPKLEFKTGPKPLLENIYTYNTGISSINLADYPKLKILTLDGQEIKPTIASLDARTNANLESIQLQLPNVTNLDFSKNAKLSSVALDGCNTLTKLNLANGNNTKMSTMLIFNSAKLTCIKIDQGFTPPAKWHKPAQASYTTNNCP